MLLLLEMLDKRPTTSFPVLPNALPNSPNPCSPSGPTLGNSDTSPANPDGPLTNSDTFSAAINTSPEPLEPSPTVPDPDSLPWFTQPAPEYHDDPGAACIPK
ncbi:hypothetical protein H2248_004268 [Termitomyces sp. 'cryptogamus']|nr:hypothetical protein H2248_004268 [Termitomyces sp. 'cryptogamus']